MMSKVRSTALITGASSGIGRDLARLFAADGCDVVLVARRAEALRALAGDLAREHGIDAATIAADLAEPDAPARILSELSRDGRSIDIVVNNAGFGAQGTVAALPLERQLEMIQVNVAALTALTRLFLPGMLERNRGGILNVASTAAFQPGPLMAVYYATKAYVESFTEALAEEVRGTGLRITCLCPGPTATEFAEAAAMTDSNLFRGKTMTSADVARIGYDGWKSGKVLLVPGLSNKMGMSLVRISPRPLVRRLVKRLNGRS
jgi:short-subunit dehydrogenase